MSFSHWQKIYHLSSKIIIFFISLVPRQVVYSWLALQYETCTQNKNINSTQTKNKKILMSLFLSLVSTFHFSLFKLSLVSILKTILQLPLSSPCLYLTLFPPCLYLYWLTDGVPTPYGNTTKLGFFFDLCCYIFFFFIQILIQNLFSIKILRMFLIGLEGIPIFFFFTGKQIKKI